MNFFRTKEEKQCVKKMEMLLKDTETFPQWFSQEQQQKLRETFQDFHFNVYRQEYCDRYFAAWERIRMAQSNIK
jgi:hypothetical protein